MLSRDSVTVSVDAVCFYKVLYFFSLQGSIFIQYIGLHLFSVYRFHFFQSIGFHLFHSAFKTFNTYSRFDLFFSRQIFLCAGFQLLRQLSQSGIFHLSFVKPAHIHLLETIMSPFFHQISPNQITNAAKKKVGKVKIGGVGSGHCWSTMGPIYKKIHVINFIHFLLSARRGRA